MKIIKNIKVMGVTLTAAVLSGCVTTGQDSASETTTVTTFASTETTAPVPVESTETQDPAPVAVDSSQTNPGVPAEISPGAAEIVKLAEAGSSDDVILAYVQNSQGTFDLSADGIIYLKDLGVSSPVITAMINHDTTLRSQNPNVQPIVSAPTPDVAPPPPVTEVATADTTPPPVQVNYFYDQLRPYGSWVVLPGYGWCWQPSTIVLRHDWQPYCDGGHWVWTDAGWFWQSDYSWGWAPFHYGRWYRHESCGWVWLPDTTWAPAWVTWRTSGDSCGWAPLPPHADFDARFGFRFNGVSVRADFDFGLLPAHFTFVAFKDFGDHDFAHRRLPRTQVTQIYNQTTIINNYTVNNTTVVNRGIPLERVTAATHAQFKQVAIRDVPSGHLEPARGTGPGRTETAVYRPELKMPARPAVHIVAQKLDAQHPVVAHAEVRSVTEEHKPVTSTVVSTPRGGQPKPIVQTPTHATPPPRQPQVTSNPSHQDLKTPGIGNRNGIVNEGQTYNPPKKPVLPPSNAGNRNPAVETTVHPTPQPHQPVVTTSPSRQEIKQPGNNVPTYNPPKQPVVVQQPQYQKPSQPVVTHQPQPAPVQENVRPTRTPQPEVTRNETAARNPVSPTPVNTPPHSTYVPPRTEQTFHSNNNVPSGGPQHIASPEPAPSRNSSSPPAEGSQVFHPKGYYQTGPGKAGAPMYQGVNPTIKGQKPQ
ncbi:MAG TPA: DUF6600 domain-containing protein [Verrucomicrobiae bacterium]|jgi:hypothetical protein|nr:DUF6600 domain-containing protein [Verrucomicrobiae bacterium]